MHSLCSEGGRCLLCAELFSVIYSAVQLSASSILRSDEQDTSCRCYVLNSAAVMSPTVPQRLHKRRMAYRRQAALILGALVVLGALSLVPDTSYGEGINARTMTFGLTFVIVGTIMLVVIGIWAGGCPSDEQISDSDHGSALFPLYPILGFVAILLLWRVPEGLRGVASIVIITSLSVAFIAALARCYWFESRHDFRVVPQEEGIEMFDNDNDADEATLNELGYGEEGESAANKPEDEERLLGGR